VRYSAPTSPRAPGDGPSSFGPEAARRAVGILSQSASLPELPRDRTGWVIQALGTKHARADQPERPAPRVRRARRPALRCHGRWRSCAGAGTEHQAQGQWIARVEPGLSARPGRVRKHELAAHRPDSVHRVRDLPWLPGAAKSATSTTVAAWSAWMTETAVPRSGDPTRRASLKGRTPRVAPRAAAATPRSASANPIRRIRSVGWRATSPRPSPSPRLSGTHRWRRSPST
jgi:hypothetical protein